MRWLGLMLAAGVVMMCAPRAARAQCVTNTNDSGAGSLRACIAAATSGSTITFSSSLAGQTITLTSGHLVIGTNLTIQGLGANQLTISGGNAARVFDIATGSNAVSVTIENLTIANGNAGAICNFPWQ